MSKFESLCVVFDHENLRFLSVDLLFCQRIVTTSGKASTPFVYDIIWIGRQGHTMALILVCVIDPVRLSQLRYTYNTFQLRRNHAWHHTEYECHRPQTFELLTCCCFSSLSQYTNKTSTQRSFLSTKARTFLISPFTSHRFGLFFFFFPLSKVRKQGRSNIYFVKLAFKP